MKRFAIRVELADSSTGPGELRQISADPGTEATPHGCEPVSILTGLRAGPILDHVPHHALHLPVIEHLMKGSAAAD